MRLKLLALVVLQSIALAEVCEYRYLNENNKVVNLSFKAIDNFGCEYDYRDMNKYDKNISLLFALNSELDRVLKFIYKNKSIVFDIFMHSAPETDKIRDVVYLNNNNLLAILHGYDSYVDTSKNTIAVSAAFYHVSLYKRYNNFLLKLYSKDKSFDGVEGFYHGEYIKYQYKQHDVFLEKIKSLQITDSLILTSLEFFLKPNYTKKYDSKFAFKDSVFDLDVLKVIMNDIEVKKQTLIPYNNIAYYLQKAGSYKEAIYLLEKILKKYPNRTVAHYNLADAYWELGEKKQAIASYTTYIEQMCNAGKEKLIPLVVRDRVSSK